LFRNGGENSFNEGALGAKSVSFVAILGSRSL
jgi:hypothetical protein